MEAVACDDANGLIYIAEEENMRITSYILPTTEGDMKGNKKLTMVKNFTLSTHGGDPASGLEGLAVDSRNGLLYVTYEKKPKMVYTVDFDGNELNLVYPAFAGDLAGLDYDGKNDYLWIVSDQASR
jgi:uncharacterized protein YjiK